MRKLRTDAGRWFGLAAAILVVSGVPIQGANWREISAGLPSAVSGAAGLAVDPQNPSTLYSWTNTWARGGGLFKSTDGARTWKTISGVTGVDWLVVDPQNSSTIYAVARGGLIKSTNGGASWAGADTGLGGGGVRSLIVDPQDSNTLYAVADGRILKSTNGGASWNASDTGVAGSGDSLPISLTLDPVTPSTLYAVKWNGWIFKSTNGGENWIAIKTPTGGGFSESVLSLAIDPVTASTIYAGSFAGFTGFSGNSFDDGQGSISKSTDGGQSWTTVRAGIPANAFVRSLAIDPASPSNVYASYGVNDRWGFLKSTDGGETWTVTNAGGLLSGGLFGSPIVIDPRASSTVYAGYLEYGTGAGGILKSADAGASWNPANAGRGFVDIHTLAIDPTDAKTIYTAAGVDGVFKGVDGGVNWTKLAALRLPAADPLGPFAGGFFDAGPAYTHSLVIDFAEPHVLYALTARTNGCHYMDRLLFKSTDGGATWSDSASPTTSGCILSNIWGPLPMVMDPTDPNTLYLGGNFDGDYALLKSTDGGANWINPPGWGCCAGRALAIDPANPTTLYGGTPSGMLRSADGAATWNNTGLRAGVNALALDPINPNILYALTQGAEANSFGGLLKSTDSGANWSPINNGLAILIDTRSPVTALVVDRANTQILYAGTSGYGVFRSIDGGASWSQFIDGLTNLDIRLLALNPGRATTLYAGTGNGVFAISLAPETIR